MKTQREIKFRGWDAKAKEWNDKYSTRVGGEHNPLTEMCQWDELQEYSMDVLVESQFDIMQFTGLKDKNGVDIYEGDIIKHLIFAFYDVKQLEQPTYNKNEVVTFCRGYFGLNDEIASFDCMNHTYEVIGNIYENPELI